MCVHVVCVHEHVWCSVWVTLCVCSMCVSVGVCVVMCVCGLWRCECMCVGVCGV